MLPLTEIVPEFNLRSSDIDGCYEIERRSPHDARGSFTKIMQGTAFKALGLDTEFSECFVTHSVMGSLRGMHLQMPPADGAKLVSCLKGAMLDVAIDLRPSSMTYGAIAHFELSEDKASSVYVPSGVAHGFCAHEADALVLYLVSSEYRPELDTGVAWNSFGFSWPLADPVLSSRDRSLPSFDDFCRRNGDEND